EQSILARELGHRVANVLGLVQALASQTAVDGRTAREFRDEFRGRLQALAKAEGAALEKHGATADLQELSEDILAPYRGERPEAIYIAGPS
ncbi:HWE histidine kinase domain-containing protein, partial [Sulfitobacter sp. HI0021]